MFVGRASDLPNSGDAKPVPGHPYFLIRNGTGVINCFHNVCRHRGSELIDGPCHKKDTVVCPYHAWTYDFDGKLVVARLWCMEPRWCDRPFPGWLADPDCVWFRRTDRAVECVDLDGDFGLLGLECASVELAAVEPLDASHGCFAKRSQSVALSFLPVHPSLRRDLRRMVLPFRSAMRGVRGRNGCGAWRDDDFRW